MKKKNVVIIAILLVGMLNLRLQCDKNFEGTNPETKYEFKESVSINPYKLDYNVGDTIWLEVNIPGKELFDEKTNRRIFFDSANFSTIAQVELLYNNPFISTGPFSSFVFPTGISAYASSGPGQTFARINYGCSSSTDYTLQLGIVFVEKGVFGISFFNSSIQNCITDHAQNSKLTYVFGVNDSHRQFYQQLPFSAIGKKPDSFVLDRLDKKTLVVVNVQ